MQTVELKAVGRTTTGKGHARQLRRNGSIPGILYGHNENMPVAVEAHMFEQLLRHVSSGNAIFDVKLEGREGEEIKALIKEVQRHPISELIVHFDLEHIQMDQKVRVKVPVYLNGSSIGVKLGGILEHLQRSIEVECLASDIPAEIALDINDLDRGESIHVRDLDLPNVHILNSPEQVIAAVVAKAKEEEVAVEAEEVAEGEAAAPTDGEAAPTTEESKEASEEKK